jgi:hypothetical protein
VYSYHAAVSDRILLFKLSYVHSAHSLLPSFRVDKTDLDSPIQAQATSLRVLMLSGQVFMTLDQKDSEVESMDH